tara:strand:+ start:3465 stop:5036 length:1572 start_codon:yes stop_codon:yes gene_type:complete
MLRRYTASADNTIVNAYQPNLTTRGTGSNMGRADIIEVFSIYGRVTTSSQELSRALIKFPITTISSDRTSGKIPASGTVSFYMKVYNAPHARTTPVDYKLVAAAVTKEWQEGDGLDLEGYKDLVQGNIGSDWIQAREGTNWTSVGGDFKGHGDTSGEYVYEQSFPQGTEDMEINITPMVEHWIAGDISNYGVIIKLSGSYEARASAAYVTEDSSVALNTTGATKSYYTKRFFGKGSQFFFKRPVIEARWDSTTKDDRGNFYFSSSRAPSADNLNKIYFYNMIRGRLRNIPGIGTTYGTADSTVRISLFSGSKDNSRPSGSALTMCNSVTVVTGGWVSTGIYSCSICIASSSTSPLYDVWFSGSNAIANAATSTKQYFTGTIQPLTYDTGISTADEVYRLAVTNLQPRYLAKDTVRLNLFVREKYWKPTIYTVANSQVESQTVVSASYRVYRLLDGYEAITYGTGSDYHTGLSYDVSGNYLDLDMSLLESGYAYGLKFAFYDDRNASWQEQQEVFKFRVEDYEY